MAKHGPMIPRHFRWFEALHELALWCVDAAPVDACDRARELNDLLQLAPNSTLIHGLMPLGEGQLEAMLVAGAADAAVMAMFHDDVGYMLSRRSGGRSLATVAFSHPRREHSSAGDTPALALIGALALALADASVSVEVPPRRVAHERPAVLH